MAAPTGSRTLEYGRWNEQTRIYEFDGEVYPSVTSVIGMMDKPVLINWAANLAAQYSQDNREALIQLEPQAAVDAIKGAWRRSRDKAANFGTAVHEMIESGQEPEPESPLAPYVDAARMFLDDYGLLVSGLEVTVVSLEHGYAGTMDVLGTTDDDDGTLTTVVADWKSGKGLYDSAAMQLSALMNADHIVNDDGTLSEIDPVHEAVAVRLPSKGTYQAETLTRESELGQRTFAAFLGLIPVWHYKTKAEVWQ